jgi:hypothetical protein
MNSSRLQEPSRLIRLEFRACPPNQPPILVQATAVAGIVTVITVVFSHFLDVDPL